MNPQESADFTAFVRRLRDESKLTVLMIEHDMRVVMGISDRVSVLDYGEKIAEGSPERGAEERARDRGLPRQGRGRGHEAAGALMTHDADVVVSVAEPPPNGDLVLELADIHTYYGSIHALKGISLEVRSGEIVTLLGANGAGKSTTLRSINGLQRPRQGSIQFEGRDITQVAPHEIVKRGIAQSPEGRRLFPRMTVTENLEMGAFQRTDKAGIKEDMEHVFELFPRLQERRTQKAGTMSGGEQQMCAIGRALMARPSLLLLDEPSLGLAPIFVERIFEIVKTINERGHLDPARRAERPDGARPRRPRLRDGDRAASCSADTRRGAEDERAGPEDLPRRGVEPGSRLPSRILLSASLDRDEARVQPPRVGRRPGADGFYQTDSSSIREVEVHGPGQQIRTGGR